MEKIVLQFDATDVKIETIADEQYQEKMLTEVEPFLNDVVRTGYFSRTDKQDLYYEEYLLPDAKKNIVISHGFTENTEKYKELIYYFYKQKYNVFILDHQGHGKSFRMIEDYSITHVEKYDDYVEDLKAFVEKKVKPDSQGKPFVLFAHSMGGAIGALYLEKYPKDFEKAILSSPMLEIDSGNTPLWVGKLIADFKVLTGRKMEYVFTQSKFDKNEKFENSCAISKVRYNYFFQKRLEHEEYQNYCASYSWLKQSVLATKKLLKPENLSKIIAPVMLFQAENDTVVRAGGQNRFVEGVKNAKLVFVPESKHEIFMAHNKIITPYLTKIFEFIG
jgi:lysophospholipase